MKEAQVDLFEIIGMVDWACIPTNGTRTATGQAVMGRGVALLAKTRWPLIPDLLGAKLARGNNVPYELGYVDKYMNWSATWSPAAKTKLWSFPTKHHWRDLSDMGLILNSARFLAFAANGLDIDIAIPRPGCGNGGLDWEDVRQDLKKILDDRFTLISDK